MPHIDCKLYASYCSIVCCMSTLLWGTLGRVLGRPRVRFWGNIHGIPTFGSCALVVAMVCKYGSVTSRVTSSGGDKRAGDGFSCHSGSWLEFSTHLSEGNSRVRIRLGGPIFGSLWGPKVGSTFRLLTLVRQLFGSFMLRIISRLLSAT